jgi:hypothetical protein
MDHGGAGETAVISPKGKIEPLVVAIFLIGNPLNAQRIIIIGQKTSNFCISDFSK